MKKLLLILTILLSSGYSQLTPCVDYTCDSLAVKAIIDGNGFGNFLSVKDVSYSSNNRISGLYISSKNLTSLPSEIGKLTKLNLLALGNNQLTSIPTEIGWLTALITLSLDNNQLASLPNEIGKLTALTILTLDNNQLTSVPTEIGKLTKLKLLTLGNNQLTSIPHEIGKLTALTTLSIDNNQLTNIPTGLGNLTSLTELFLNNNQLPSLPAEIGNLTALDVMYLGNNQLTSLPPEIIQLDLIILLDDNRLCSVPDSIAIWIDENYASWATANWREVQNCPTGNEEPLIGDDNKISIHLTPFNRQVTISFDNIHPSKSLSIYNINGKLVKRFKGITKSTIWNTEGQSRGVYYLKAVIGDEQIVRKFVLE